MTTAEGPTVHEVEWRSSDPDVPSMTVEMTMEELEHQLYLWRVNGVSYSLTVALGEGG